MTIFSGKGGFVGAETITIHTGKGALIGLVVSHAEESTQVVTIYDSLSASGSIMLRLRVHPTRSPFYVWFPSKYRPRYHTGLTVAAGNCDVNVLAGGV